MTAGVPDAIAFELGLNRLYLQLPPTQQQHS